MFKCTLSLVFVGLLHLSGYSQDFKISLQEHRLSLPAQAFFISRVIDSRLDQSNVGMAKKGVGNVRKMAEMANSLSHEITALCNRSLPPAAGKKAIILKVTEFKVQEESQGYTERATAEVALSFLYESSPGRYLSLIDLSSEQESKGMEVTGKHDDNLVAAIRDCMLQFSELNFDELASQATPVSAQELDTQVSEPEETPDYAILRDSVIRQGAYRSFKEFCDNAPGITEPLSIKRVPLTSKTWKGTDDITLYTLDANGQKKLLKDVWGFSAGKETYIFHQGDYYPLERLGNSYTFYGRVTAFEPYKVNAATLAVGALGGAVGTMAFMTGGTSRPPNSKGKFVLDMRTGQAVDQQKDQYRKVPDSQGSANLVVYYYDTKTEPEAQLQLSLTDQIYSAVRDMPVNSSVELIWPEVRDSLSIWVNDSGESQLDFLPKGKQTTYLSCRPRSKNPADGIEIRIVEKMEADFYLNKIKSIQAKKSRK